MNARNLGLLGSAALLIVIAALWLGHSRPSTSASEPNVYPELKGKLDAVTGVAIFKAGDQSAVQLVRNGDAWQVKERSDYPADASKIKTLLIHLEDAKLREQKTANPANYSALGVQDLNDTATTGVRVELAGAPVPVKLIVGKRDVNTHATYVRRAGEAQSWLASAELDAPSDPTQWLKRDVINISADRVQEVAIQPSGAASYTSSKNTRADTNFDVKPVPKGRELNSVSAPNAVAQSLASLQLDDVKKVDAAADGRNSAHAKFLTFDGLVIDCTGYVDGERRWVTFHADFDANLAKRFFVATVAPDKKDADATAPQKPAPAADNSLEELTKKGEAEAAALNKNLESWSYSIPTYKYDAIFKPLEELLKKPEMLKKK